MKKLIITLTIIAFAFNSNAQQINDYAVNWKKVENYENKGLTKSALNEVINIYQLAIKDHNEPQQIKCCIYQLDLRSEIQENATAANIFFLDTLINKTTVPSKNILLSIKAEMLWNYFQRNRWDLYNRTTLAEEKSNDITTWSAEKIQATIAEIYSTSLSNSVVLKNTGIAKYSAIIIKGANTATLRPTLFDFLAQRALEYFMNDEADVTKPAYAFTIKSADFFSPANVFANLSFNTQDTASRYFKAILLFQDLLKFHAKDLSPSALIDADIERISFIYSNAVMPDKDNLYEDALRTIERSYPRDSVTSQAAFLRAEIYYNRGREYIANNKSRNQFELVKAKKLCDSIIARFPKNEGGINAKNLLGQILSPTLRIEIEKVNEPKAPFRSLVTYKNLNTVFIRIIKQSNEEITRLNYLNGNLFWKSIINLTPVKQWSIALPDEHDYQQHAAEIKIDGLPVGAYIVLASKDSMFSLSKNVLTKQVIYVSNISFINNDTDYYVLDRDNGTPLSHAKVQAWESKYDPAKGQYEHIKAEQYLTDNNGYFKIKKKKDDSRRVLLQINNGNDELFLDDEISLYQYNSYDEGNEDQSQPKTFLFTDRSIYRPGQTMYFKGIVVKKDSITGKTTVIPKFNTSVTLTDANGQEVSSITVTTNEYGSYNGKFILPTGALTGQFIIKDSVTNDDSYFNVEEYKRPKFYVEIAKPKGIYRLYDSVTVTGNAKAYAGNSVDGANIKYRVIRKIHYPIWFYESSFSKIRYFGEGSGMEISNGEITTDATGAFKITFKAIPDESIDKNNDPIFNYEISADITDINGETRSGNTSVELAYQALQLNINLPGQLLSDSLKDLRISSANFNDLFESTSVNVTISRLQSPGKIFRTRYWDMPDEFIMSKDEFYKYFPYDPYKNENEISSWPIAEKVIDKTDSTKENQQFLIKDKALQAGWYKIIATTKDKYGEEVKAIKFIQLTNINSKTELPIEINADKETAQPGEKISFNISTGFDKIWLIQSLHKLDKTSFSYQTIQQDKNVQVPLSLTEADRGGIALNGIFIKHNNVYTIFKGVAIPWSNKELNIGFNTFRDKLLPGSAEKWSMKISGNAGEKISAEILTSMYDASLDQFYPGGWQKPDVWENINFYDLPNKWDQSIGGFNKVVSDEISNYIQNISEYRKTYAWLLNSGNRWGDQSFGASGGYFFYNADMPNKQLSYKKNSVAIAYEKFTPPKVVRDAESKYTDSAKLGEDLIPDQQIYSWSNGNIKTENKQNTQQSPNVQIRKNFNETAFFFPDLKTDADGNVTFSFTIPEALTQWKLMTLAHTKDMATGYLEKTVITQKPLMIQPNVPRFLREGDTIEFSAKVVNLSDSSITGKATLQLLDAATNNPVDRLFQNNLYTQSFTVAAGQSAAVKFPLNIPVNFNSALTYRIVAVAGNSSDGEENALSVLTNRTLVTESMPLNMRNTAKKDFKFEKLLNSNSSKTLSNHALTVEFTSNPAWYAVQALPYLMEYPYECAEQTFNRYYANALATHISNSTPRIKAVFDKWSHPQETRGDTSALQSNLQKNEELKSALLQETPWVMDAQNEAQQKKNIALLFDMDKMSKALQSTLDKLKDMQLSNGGFMWFKDGPDDRYITQYILTGIGHLKKLNVLDEKTNSDISTIIASALPYLDKKIKADYDNLIKEKVKLSADNLSDIDIQYLYMRSFFADHKIPAATQTAYNYYKGQAQKYWLKEDKYMQAMIALTLNRMNDISTPKDILRSLKENAINNEEMGMYWKEFDNGGYYWYQAPIESQALMIEAFTEIDKDVNTINDLKTWLIKQKQTQDWKTTKATAEACYALLLNGSNWLNEEKNVQIQLGNTVIQSNPQTDEAGTGYFKKRIEGPNVKPNMGNITVSINQSTNQPITQSTSWGSVYWQYFEDLDKITPAETRLKLTKKLFIEKNTDKGPVLIAVEDTSTLKVGDKIKVRIILKADRDMEYVHMKDMRGACMEPVDVISGYKWQDGLGYYQSTKDASTNFFFNWLPKGTYVFEYSMFVTNAGNFSNGITTIQCMYAPEFSAHSEGVRVVVH